MVQPLVALSIRNPNVVEGYTRGLLAGERIQASRADRAFQAKKAEYLDEEADRARRKDLLETGARLVAGILKVPEAQRQIAWQDALGRYAEAGGDPSQLPQRYRPGMAEFYRAQIAEAKTLFDAEEAEPVKRGEMTPEEYAALSDEEKARWRGYDEPAPKGVRPNPYNYVNQAGDIRVVDENNMAEVNQARQDGFVRGPAIGTQDPSAKLRIKAEAAASEAAVQEGFNIAGARSLLRQAQEIGSGVAGLRGLVGLEGGGLLGQLNQTLGSKFAEFVAGTTPEELQAFSTEARAFIGKSISTFTGEEGNRFTEREREIAETATALLKAAKSYPQLVTAIESSMKLSILARERHRFEANEPYTYDLSNDAGKRAAIEDLRAKGLSDRAIIETMRSIEEVQEELGTRQRD